MKSLVIDNVTIKEANQTNSRVLIGLSTEGFNFPTISLSKDNRPGEDGLRVSTAFYDGRVVTIEGIIQAVSSAAFSEYRQALQQACALIRDENGLPIAKRVDFTAFDDQSYYVYAYVEKLNLIRKNEFSGNFQINIVCPDPRIYSTVSNFPVPITRSAGGGFILPVVLPIISAAQTGGFANVNNIGNAPVFPVLTLRGAATNPRFTHRDSGRFLKIITTTDSDDVIEVDMAEKVITKNGTSLMSAKSEDSDWWHLEPGVNQIGYTTDSVSDDGTLEISYANGYWGIE